MVLMPLVQQLICSSNEEKGKFDYCCVCVTLEDRVLFATNAIKTHYLLL